MPTDRRPARILAMQTLCQWEVQGAVAPEELAGLQAFCEASEQATEYAQELTQGFWQDPQRVDTLLAETTEHWSLARISSVERNVLRVAVVEILQGAVPPKVALNEAIEIAREYGGADSPRFVNGVLDKIYRNQVKEDD